MGQLKREIKRFIMVGMLAVCTDCFFYYALINFFNHSLSKAVSYICGTVVAYLLNKYWTFQKEEKSAMEMFCFMILYAFSLGANVFVNRSVLMFSPPSVLLAFCAATATSTVLNFTGQKWWVFKEARA